MEMDSGQVPIVVRNPFVYSGTRWRRGAVVIVSPQAAVHLIESKKARSVTGAVTITPPEKVDRIEDSGENESCEIVRRYRCRIVRPPEKVDRIEDSGEGVARDGVKRYRCRIVRS